MKPVNSFGINRTIVAAASAVLLASAGPLAAQVTTPGGKPLPDSAQKAPPFQGGGGNFNALLKGEYIYSGGSATCIHPPFRGGFDKNLQVIDANGLPTQGGTSHNSVNGIRVFNGDGTGSFKGRSVSTGTGGASVIYFGGDFTYEVAPDLTITIRGGDSSGEVVIGNPRLGRTFELSGVPPFAGYISEDLEEIHVLTSLSEKEAVEVMTSYDENGNEMGQSPRICYRDRSMRKLKR